MTTTRIGTAIVFCFLLTTQIQGQEEDLREEELSAPFQVKEASQKSRIALYENAQLAELFKIDEALTKEAFDQTLLAYTQTNSRGNAWLKLVQPSDRIGIKINTIGGKVLQTKPSIVKAIVYGLIKAGVNRKNIIIWDKFADHMASADWNPERESTRWKERSVVPGTGFDSKKFLFHEVVGKLIWGDYEFVGKKALDLDLLLREYDEDRYLQEGEGNNQEDPSGRKKRQISNRSFFAKIVTQDVDKIINVAIMSDHPSVGVWGCLSSLALSSVDNNRRFNSSKTYAARAIAEILSKEYVKDKIVLHVMDGTLAQFAGGPLFETNYCQTPGILMISQDGVAIDTLVREQLEIWREARSVVPIGESALHIEACESFGLGTTDKSKMEIIKVAK
ncbi:MAG: DUF362 domain-containing protein [Verrucomicrobiota bacterium]